MGFIYKITNDVDDKIYIGKTVKTVEKRFNEHCKMSEKYHKDIGFNSKLYPYMNKYGVDKFHVETLEECDNEKLNELEIYHISKIPKELSLNISSGGDGGDLFKGHHHSEKTKLKMSEDRKGNKNGNYGNRWNQSDELKKLHSVLSSGENNGMYGKKHSEETKLKISMSNSGKIKSQNTLNKLKISMNNHYENVSKEKELQRKGNISKSLNNYYETHEHHSKGKIYVNDGVVNKLISKDDLQFYLNNGYKLHKKPRK